MRALYVRDWNPLGAAMPYFMSRPETLPPLRRRAARPCEVRGRDLLLQGGRLHRLGRRLHAQGLYDTYGDFAVGAAIAHEFAHAVQVRATISTQKRFELEQHADCQQRWVASTVYENGVLRLTEQATWTKPSGVSSRSTTLRTRAVARRRTGRRSSGSQRERKASRKGP